MITRSTQWNHSSFCRVMDNNGKNELMALILDMEKSKPFKTIRFHCSHKDTIYTDVITWIICQENLTF